MQGTCAPVEGGEGEEDAIELDCDAGEFSCSLDGVALTCADIKAAMADNTCE